MLNQILSPQNLLERQKMSSAVVELPGLLPPAEQLELLSALGALPCPKADDLASVRIELGLDRAGAPLPPSLGALAATGRRAFRRAAAAVAAPEAPAALSSLGRDDAELTATALVYGARASMRDTGALDGSTVLAYPSTSALVSLSMSSTALGCSAVASSRWCAAAVVSSCCSMARARRALSVFPLACATCSSATWRLASFFFSLSGG